MSDSTAVCRLSYIATHERTVNAVQQKIRVKNCWVGPKVHHALAHADIRNVRNPACLAGWSLSCKEDVSDTGSPALCPDLVVVAVGSVGAGKVELSRSNIGGSNHYVLSLRYFLRSAILAIDQCSNE